jgi:hypothetical protein
MRITLFILSLVAAAGGAALLLLAESPSDELGAGMLFVVAATMLSGSAVIEAMTQRERALDETHELLLGLANELKDSRRVDAADQNEEALREPAYVVRTGNDSSGPFPVDKIKELRRRGAIDDDTPVALAGRNEWKRTCEVIGLMRQNVARVSHH